MKHKQLGDTDLHISAICLGTMTFGDDSDDESCKRIYSLAREAGINLFDCANVYGQGKAEEMLGTLIQGHRQDIFITTKAGFPMDNNPDSRGLDRASLERCLHDSLIRLNTDYVDIFFLHCFDAATPLEETIAVAEEFVQQGKVRYLGVSNFAAWQVMKATNTAGGLGAAKISCIQPMYNLLKRQAETELLPMAISENIGVLAYGPIAGGLLTGKYQHDGAGDGRFQRSKMYQARYLEGWISDAVSSFVEIANDLGYEPAALAVAWAAANPAVAAPLIGARTPRQLVIGMKAANIEISDELYATLTSLTPTPSSPTDRSEERV